MSDDKLIDTELSSLVDKAAAKKIIKEKPKLIKSIDLTKMPEIKSQVIQMNKDGFSVEQIAAAMGYESDKVAWLLEDNEELGTPEQILQESLRTLVSLIPIADSVYRTTPTFNNSLAITGMIDSTKGVIQEIYNLKDKEETYRTLITKVLQPLIRQMIQDLMHEFKHYSGLLESSSETEKLNASLQQVAVNMGKKIDEAYRKAHDGLAVSLGLSQDAKLRVMAGIALSDEKS